jgi:methylenetetrahydrofolate dehydrogenase (NADP+)/methenyltetrahydrofolate cyclohydrolase
MKQNGHTPTLGVILVGSHTPSETYVKHKALVAEKLGMHCIVYRFPNTVTQNSLLQKIKTIQKNKQLTGLIVQLPVPEHLHTPELLNAVRPEIDIDCLNETTMGKMVQKTNTLIPPTAGAVLEILKSLDIDVAGKDICLVGMGILVGKPLSILLPNLKASITTCNSQTKNLKEKCLRSDIIITGVGKKDLIRGNMVKPGSIVIDAGVAFEGAKMYGDVNVGEVVKKAAAVTPTPGGVGPITISLLLYNTLLAAEQKYTND